MNSNTNPMRNVGTPEHPVSWLHELTVAVLYDELTRDRVIPPQGRLAMRREEMLRVRLTPGGDLSHDLRDGVVTVKIPDPEWDIIGGIIPDLALYGEDSSRPVRIIEVTVSNPPDAAKRQKMDKLQERGVDVVEIVVKSEDDLRNLVEVAWTPVFIKGGGFSQADKEMRNLLAILQGCSPSMRRAFKQLLIELDSLDSLYPLSRTNPLTQKLEGQ